MKALFIVLILARHALASNSNQCLQDLGALNAACPSSTLIPSNNCCLAVSKLNKDGCFCSPVLPLLMGQTAYNQVKNTLMPICATLAVVDVTRYIPCLFNKCKFTAVSCTPFNIKTYAGGSCALNNMQMDAARIQNVLGFSNTYQSYAQNTQQCFAEPIFEAAMSAFFNTDINVTVSYGVGKYVGIRASTEYLAIPIPGVSSSYWLMNFPPQATDPNALLVFSPQGIVVGASGGGGKFLKGCYDLPVEYIETVFDFVGCNTKVDALKVPDVSSLNPARKTALSNLGEIFYHSAQETASWGFKNICAYHDQYCTGPNKQFESNAECMRFMAAVPSISPACGAGGILGGNSSTCRFKHHFMVPLSADVHCAHIGYGQTPDKNGAFKCNDAIECAPGHPALGNPAYVDVTPIPAFSSCAAADRAAYTGFVAPNIC